MLRMLVVFVIITTSAFAADSPEYRELTFKVWEKADINGDGDLSRAEQSSLLSELTKERYTMPAGIVFYFTVRTGFGDVKVMPRYSVYNPVWYIVYISPSKAKKYLK